MSFKTLVTRSDLGEDRKAEPLVLAELSQLGYSEEAVFAVRLALEEALANAVNHGNRRDASKSVRVEYQVGPVEAIIRVSDEGPGFDRGQVPDPTLPENREKSCGRGIMLMEAYMSRVRWNDRGNQVEMVKLKE